MPARLRPTAPIASDAILVGDPGRALMLAQELLQQPKMSNHVRGLWGYSGGTRSGQELTIQSTGMGGPSATVVLRDLVELGVRRAVRLGTGTSLSELGLGELLIVAEAEALRVSFAGSGTAEAPRDAAYPDPELTAGLEEALPDARTGLVVSLDDLHAPERKAPSMRADVADMQTAALFGAGARLGIAVAGLLIVTERSGIGQLRDDDLEEAAKQAGRAAATALSP
jgi:purine-nucleoside phosphorylase